MYCINCGVKLEDTENKCPLCNTVVYHSEITKEPSRKLYPSNKMPKSSNGFKALGGAIIIVFLIPIVLSFFTDMQLDGKIDWCGYVAGALAVSYVSFALPLWFKKPNPVIFVPCSFVAQALYLFYINFATNGTWYWGFALPIITGLCLIASAVTTLIKYVKRGRLYIFGGTFIFLGGYMLLIEYLIHKTFGVTFIGWSIYPLIVLFLIGGLLIYLGIDSNAREAFERKLFF